MGVNIMSQYADVMSEELATQIRALAARGGLTSREYVRRAVSAQKFLDAEHAKGNDILIRESGKTEATRVVTFR